MLLAAIALATGGTPPFWLFVASLVPVLLAHGFAVPNLSAAAMMPMGRIAGTAAAVTGAISTLGGAAIGATIDRAFDGSILPLAVAGAVLGCVGYASYRWSDVAWTRASDEELGPTAVPHASSVPQSGA